MNPNLKVRKQMRNVEIKNQNLNEKKNVAVKLRNAEKKVVTPEESNGEGDSSRWRSRFPRRDSIVIGKEKLKKSKIDALKNSKSKEAIKKPSKTTLDKSQKERAPSVRFEEPESNPEISKDSKPQKVIPKSKAVIEYPPLKRRTWTPPERIVKKPKPVVNLPPLKTKPWEPPTRKKEIKKPVIEYPALKLKPWVSPYLLQKLKPKVRLQRSKIGKIFRPPCTNNLEKGWHNFKNLNPKLMILKGSFSHTSKKFSYVSNGKQGAFISIVALVTAHLYPIKFWNDQDLDEIVMYGDFNYRKQLRRLQRKELILKPPEIKFKVYIPRGKVITAIGMKTLKGFFDDTNLGELKDHVIEILNDFKGLIFSYGAQNFAIWSDDDSYYLFNCEDTDSKGNSCGKHNGSSCILRATKTVDPLVEYLGSFIKLRKKFYELYSFSINDKNYNGEELESFEEIIEEPLKDDQPNSEPTEELAKSIEPGKEGLLCSNSMPNFSESFKRISRDHGFLEASCSLTDIEAAPLTAASSLIFLKYCHSYLWKAETIQEIFKLGEKIYSETELKDVPLTELRPVVAFGKQILELVSENVVFGRVVSKNLDVDLEHGLEYFFNQYDSGIIQGPETVAVWRESDLYFLLDSYKRSSEDSVGLHWVKNLKDLCQFYIGNLSKENRKDIFKICKVEISKFVEKSENWNSFKATGLNKWILSGTLSEECDTFEKTDVDGLDICTNIVAIGKCRVLGIQNWSSENIDNIVKMGHQFYLSSVAQLKSKDENSDKLDMKDIESIFHYDSKIVDFVFEEEYIGGSVEKNEANGLEKGLKEFFDVEETSIVSICGISVAVWKTGDFYYLFDGHGRDELGRNLTFLGGSVTCTMYPGFACVLRFSEIPEIVNHILSIVEITESTKFIISKVEPIVRSDEMPCLYNYSLLGGSEFSAILRASNQMHEDHETFRAKMKQKTICNSLTALCFEKILNPRLWDGTDINDILKIGYKLLCGIAKKLNKDDSTPFDLLEKISISTFEMTVTSKSAEEGCFCLKKYPLSHIRNEEEVVKDTVVMQQISDGNTQVPEADNEANAVKSDTSTVANLDEYELPTLTNLLRNWDTLDEVTAILVSNLFTLALWKHDKLYYLFEPKASDESGKLVKFRLDSFVVLYSTLRKVSGEEKLRKSRLSSGHQPRTSSTQTVTFVSPKPSLFNVAPNMKIEEENLSVAEEGCAYTAWFTSVDLLIRHIRDKVPMKFGSEQFTIHYFNIEKEASKILEIEPTNQSNFVPVSENHWMIRASMSQNDHQFSPVCRNNQDSANCIMSLIFSQLTSADEWKRCVLDIILKYGDRLYRKSLKKLPKLHKSQENLKISLDELDFPVVLGKFVVTVDHEMVKKDQLSNLNEPDPIQDFKVSLEEFFKDQKNLGILVSKNYSVAIWKHQEQFLMFDPHDVGPNGYRKSTGVACLQKFGILETLINVFTANIEELEGYRSYELHKIMIAKTLINDMKDQDSCGDYAIDGSLSVISNCSFLQMNQGCRVIRGKRSPPIRCFESCEPSVYYSAAALCIQNTINLIYFTRDTIDMIMNFGKSLYEECEHNCFPNICLSDDAITPGPVTWNFTINDTKYTICLQKFKQGIIKPSKSSVSSLKNSLYDFFDFYCNGILVTKKFISPFWKENRMFVMFYSRPIDSSGKFWDSPNSFPGICVFEEFDDFYLNILDNVDREDYESAFEIRISHLKHQNLLEKHSCSSSSFEEEYQVVKPAIIASDISSDSSAISVPKKVGGDKIPVEAIFGNLSKVSKYFSEYTRKFHSGTICLTAAAFSSTQSVDTWNGATLDFILQSGNSLFMEYSIVNNSKKFLIDNIRTKILINDTKVDVKTIPLTEVNQEGFNEECFSCCVKELFEASSIGFINSGLEYLAVFKDDTKFYIFDPLGLRVAAAHDHQACLSSFKKFSEFVANVLRYLKSNEFIDTTSFKFSAVFVERDHS